MLCEATGGSALGGASGGVRAWQGADVNVHVGVIEDFVQDDQHPLPPHSVEPCSETGGLDISHSENYHLSFQLPKTFFKGCL